MLAVRAGCLMRVAYLLLLLRLGLGLCLAAGCLVFAAAAFGGEIDAALWIETGDVRFICGKDMLGDGAVPSTRCQCLKNVL